MDTPIRLTPIEIEKTAQRWADVGRNIFVPFATYDPDDFDQLCARATEILEAAEAAQ